MQNGSFDPWDEGKTIADEPGVDDIVITDGDDSEEMEPDSHELTIEAERANIPIPQPRARIVVAAGRDEGRRFELTGDSVSLGRAMDNDIVLTDLAVSRKHLTLQKSGDEFYLQDQSSGNGTLLNGRDEDGRNVLRHGDRIEVGNTVLRFENPRSTLIARSKVPSSLPPPRVAPELPSRARNKTTMPPPPPGARKELPVAVASTEPQPAVGFDHQPKATVMGVGGQAPPPAQAPAPAQAPTTGRPSTPFDTGDPYPDTGHALAADMVVVPPSVVAKNKPRKSKRPWLFATLGFLLLGGLGAGIWASTRGTDEPVATVLPEGGEVETVEGGEVETVEGGEVETVEGNGGETPGDLTGETKEPKGEPTGETDPNPLPLKTGTRSADSLPAAAWGTPANEPGTGVEVTVAVVKATIDDPVVTAPPGNEVVPDPPTDKPSNEVVPDPPTDKPTTEPVAGKQVDAPPTQVEPADTKDVQEEARALYKKQRFSSAADVLAEAAEKEPASAKDLTSLSQRYRALGAQFARGKSTRNKASALSAYRKAKNLDRSLGGEHQSELNGKIRRAAPAAAEQLLAKGDYTGARQAAALGPKREARPIYEAIDEKAKAQLQRAKQLSSGSAASKQKARVLLKQVKSMSRTSSSAYRDATKLLAKLNQ